MGDVKNGYQATPNATLEQQMMDACAPKNEREWWAFAEIGRLRAEVEALRADAERKRIELETMGDTVTSLRSEVALYRGESTKFRDLLNSVPLPPFAITYERGWKLIDTLQAAAIDAARAAQGEKA